MIDTLTLKILIPCLFLVDILLTWWNTKKYKKLFPGKDWTAHEVNPLVKFLWKKFGLNKGTILASIFAVGLIAIIIFYYGRDYLLVLLGAYIPIIAIHIKNFVDVLPKEKKMNKNLTGIILFVLLFLANLYYVIFSFTWINLGITIIVLVAVIHSIKKYRKKK